MSLKAYYSDQDCKSDEVKGVLLKDQRLLLTRFAAAYASASRTVLGSVDRLG